MLIQCKNGQTLIDDSDFSKIEGYTVGINKPKHQNYQCAYILINGKKLLLHRHLLGLRDSMFEVDHIDRNPLNNQKANLRVVSRQTNARNVGRNTSTDRFGVVLYKTRLGGDVRYVVNNQQVKHHFYCLEAASCYADCLVRENNPNALPCELNYPDINLPQASLLPLMLKKGSMTEGSVCKDNQRNCYNYTFRDDKGVRKLQRFKSEGSALQAKRNRLDYIQHKFTLKV